MVPTHRIIVNTIAQYTRSVLNAVLSLFSVRYIVEALGSSDYGLFVVIGGVISLLGFVTNALITTTQRFLSYSYGSSDKSQIKKVFANSFFVHLVFAALIFVFLMAMRDMMIFQWLNIPTDRYDVAPAIYLITAIILVVTVITVPFKALFIARENIVFISLVDIFDGFLKLGVALCLLWVDTDRLILYALFMLGIQLFNMVLLSSYALRRFEECHVLISPREIDYSLMRQLAGFAGWMTYGMGAVVLRSQGIQILLNRIYGTVINAAYGIASHVFASVAFISTSILNAMNPQIVKAKGEGNHQRMVHLAEMEAKYSTMMLMLILIPAIFETPDILALWLKEVPDHTVMFCRFLLCCLIIDQTTYSMNTVNQAMGNVRNYILLTYTPKILILLPIYIILLQGFSPFAVMALHTTAEVVTCLIRLVYMGHNGVLQTRHYLKTAILPLLPLLAVQCLVCVACTQLLDLRYRFLITLPLSMSVCALILWRVTLSSAERQYMLSMFKSVVGKTRCLQA